MQGEFPISVLRVVHGCDVAEHVAGNRYAVNGSCLHGHLMVLWGVRVANSGVVVSHSITMYVVD